MKPQTLIAAVAAVGLAAAAMILTQKALTQPEKTGDEDMIQVVRATVSLQGGSILNDTMLEIKKYPKDDVPEGAITEMDKALGRAVRHPVDPKEVITEAKLAPEGAGGGMEAVIEEGKRAVAVAIQTDRAIAGFVIPNSRVDILLHVPQGGPDSPPKVKTILQDVKVLAVNSDMQENGTDKGKVVEAVTFELTPDDAKKLFLAQQTGQLQLMLRSPVDDEETTDNSITLTELLQEKSTKSERADEPEPIFLDDSKVADDKSGTFDMLGKFLTNVAQAQAPVEEPQPIEEPAPVETAPAPAPTPLPIATPPVAKKLKRLVYRDLDGNVLMEVVVDAESKVAKSCPDLVEDYELNEFTAPVSELGSGTTAP